MLYNTCVYRGLLKNATMFIYGSPKVEEQPNTQKIEYIWPNLESFKEIKGICCINEPKWIVVQNNTISQFLFYDDYGSPVFEKDYVSVSLLNQTIIEGIILKNRTLECVIIDTETAEATSFSNLNFCKIENRGAYF